MPSKVAGQRHVHHFLCLLHAAGNSPGRDYTQRGGGTTSWPPLCHSARKRRETRLATAQPSQSFTDLKKIDRTMASSRGK